MIFIDLFQIDFALADWIYQQTAWSLKKSFLFETLLHKSARVVLIAVYLVIGWLWLQNQKTQNKEAARHLFVLLFAIGSSVLWVTVLKRFLDVDCPWDLIRYGGNTAFQSIFNYTNTVESAHCFPASHASVGFSWVAVYFYYLVTRNNKLNKALIIALVLGTVFGFAQQLRGAHFVSHDIWSLIICLINSMVIYSMAYGNLSMKSLKSRFYTDSDI